MGLGIPEGDIPINPRAPIDLSRREEHPDTTKLFETEQLLIGILGDIETVLSMKYDQITMNREERQIWELVMEARAKLDEIRG